MSTKSLRFLPPNKFQVLKVIQIDGPDWFKFWGYLPYLRNYDKNKAEQEDDFLDARILESIRHYFPKAHFRIKENILFENQLENSLRHIEGGSAKKITIQFTPEIPYDLIPRYVDETFTAYPWDFTIRLLTGETDKLDLINSYYICNVPFDKIDDIIKTVRPA